MKSVSRRDLIRGSLGAACSLSAGLAFAGTSAVARAASDEGRSPVVVDGLDPSPLTKEYIDLLRTGGVHCWHQTVDDLPAFSALLEFCDQYKSLIRQAGSVREIRHLRQEKIMSHVSGWQSADGLVVSGEPMVSSLRAYRKLGLRICGVAYNVANAFGGGCLDAQVGLTRAGHRLIEEIHREQILLDVGGHTNEQTSFDAIAISSGVPVICTHTNVRALNDNPRCTSDRLFEAIAGTGGVIGLSAFSDFHVRKASDANVARSPQAALDVHLDQYDYLKRLIGADHIGIGPDFLEGSNFPGSVSPADMVALAPDAYSQEMPWYYVKGFENIGELPNVTRGLLARGWSRADLDKVLGENWLRVYEQAWGA